MTVRDKARIFQTHDCQNREQIRTHEVFRCHEDMCSERSLVFSCEADGAFGLFRKRLNVFSLHHFLQNSSGCNSFRASWLRIAMGLRLGGTVYICVEQPCLERLFRFTRGALKMV